MAKRPPSNCTMGRRSGGSTGRARKTIHSGLLPDLRSDSTTRSRFMARLRRWPELEATSACSRSLSPFRSTRFSSSKTASAPMPMRTTPG